MEAMPLRQQQREPPDRKKQKISPKKYLLQHPANQSIANKHAKKHIFLTMFSGSFSNFAGEMSV